MKFTKNFIKEVYNILFVNSGTGTLSSTLRQFGSTVTTVCTENMSAEKKETAFGDQNKFANFSMCTIRKSTVTDKNYIFRITFVLTFLCKKVVLLQRQFFFLFFLFTFKTSLLLFCYNLNRRLILNKQ